MAVTKRQREVLDFISTFIETNGYSPSYDEIAYAMKLSSLATVHKHIYNLRRKRLIEVDYNRSRSIQVSKKCPTCGHGPSSPSRAALQQASALAMIP